VSKGKALPEILYLRRVIVKKIIIFAVLLSIILLTACDKAVDSDGSDIDEESSYFLQSDGSKIPLDVQYIRTTWLTEIDYPIITVVSSKNALEQYYEKNKMLILDGYNNVMLPDQNFLDAIEKYTDDYFINDYLLIVLLQENSGSIRHEVERVDHNGNIFIKRLSPGIGTADMAAWNIIIELDNILEFDEFYLKIKDGNL
jgi:predicted small secreted protein